LAELLESPRAGVLATAQRCGLSLSLRDAEATRAVARFASFAADSDPTQLSEQYRRDFLRHARTCLDVGQQLYGHDPRRGLFLLRSQAGAHAHGLSPRRASADHVSALLRLLARMAASEEARELAAEAVLPACMRVLSGLDVRSAYAPVLEAVIAVLRHDFAVHAVRVAAPARKQPQDAVYWSPAPALELAA
jgi:nitrate reductase assembly molybdenum cofactor insertion protein NarJ